MVGPVLRRGPTQALSSLGDNMMNMMPLRPAPPANAAVSRWVRRFLAGIKRAWIDLQLGLQSGLAQTSTHMSHLISRSDLVFFLALLLIWSLLFLACTLEDPTALVALTTAPFSALLGGLELMRSAFYRVPDALWWTLPSVRGDGPSTDSPLVVPPASIFLDDQALVERLVAHPSFQNVLRRVSARQVEELSRQMEAVERRKVAQVEAQVRDVLERGEREKQRLEAEIIQIQGRRQAEIGRQLAQIEAQAQERVDQALLEMENRLTDLQTQLREQRRVNVDGVPESHLVQLESDLQQLAEREAALRGQLASCCSSSDHIRSQVHSLTNDWFQDLSTGQNPLFHDLRTKLVGTCLTKDEAQSLTQAQMTELSDSLKRSLLSDLTQQSSQTIRQTAREVIQETDFETQIRDTLNAEYQKLSSNWSVSRASAPHEQVQTLVDHALRIYDADKTGRFDYALESIGGSVLTTRCTETYDAVNAVYSIFGIPIWWEKNTPRTILQPGANPGQCWAFKGSFGSVVIQLSERIRVEAVTLEHMPKMVSPTKSIESAPKQFQIYGLTDVQDEFPLSLGNFTYLDDGNSLQTFPIHLHRDREFNIVEMKILSNHGHMLYTCIYRLRVHGSTNSKSRL